MSEEKSWPLVITGTTSARCPGATLTIMWLANVKSNVLRKNHERQNYSNFLADWRNKQEDGWAWKMLNSIVCSCVENVATKYFQQHVATIHMAYSHHMGPSWPSQHHVTRFAWISFLRNTFRPKCPKISNSFRSMSLASIFVKLQKPRVVRRYRPGIKQQIW